MSQECFDLRLFRKLNEEYTSKPLVPRARSLKSRGLFEQAEERAKFLDKLLDVRGKRVLDIGCGRGHLAIVLAREYSCKVVGVDIKRYSDWDTECVHPDVELRTHDISKDENTRLGMFERAVSISVWEHIRHPYSALEGLGTLMQPDGRVYICANLYRGPRASHRYREVFFPWPHLLFQDEVFREFYRAQGLAPKEPAWVNKLTIAHYQQYLGQLKFQILKEWDSITPIDEAFYARFEDVLGRYPRFDLERDFINVVIASKATV